jgi:phosphatidylinositol glycan class B
LHARTSSENLSGTFFVLAVAIGHLFSDRREVSERTQMPASVALTVGLLLGFSFLSRFQMGFMILGFGIWCFGVAKHSWKNLVLMFSGILATLSLGVLLDWRGGGNWTFAPFNYFVAYNKVVQTHGNEVFPWWYYFHFLAGDVPLLGNLLATAVVFGCFEKPKNALVWSLVPFLLFHFIMAHKEPRYLFPLISLLPILVTLGIELLELKILKGKTIQEYTSLRWAFYGISALNMGGLLVATLKPAAVQPLVQSYVFDHQKEIQTLHFIDSHPFEMIGLPMNFYRPSHLEVAQTSTQKFSEELKKNRVPHWLFYSQYELPSEEPELQKNCQLKYSVFPRYLRSFLFLPGLRISSKASLFKCEASS